MSWSSQIDMETRMSCCRRPVLHVFWDFEAPKIFHTLADGHRFCASYQIPGQHRSSRSKILKAMMRAREFRH